MISTRDYNKDLIFKDKLVNDLEKISNSSFL